MRSVGQVSLLLALISAGYAAYVHLAPRSDRRQVLSRIGAACGILAFLALTSVAAILCWALVTRNFEFDYVAHYSSRNLAWYYSLSAFWVGQGGSLLLWCWLTALVALLFRFLSSGDRALRDTAFGIVMACLTFLIATTVFTADPLKESLSRPTEGTGLSPLLQNPSMLIHPPVVFLAYALWTVPFGLAAAALLQRRFDGNWIQSARVWAITSWTVLLAGLLLGAHWAYQELGWGGYWGWDPVENGSLLPWLTGTALIHCMMAWRHRQCLKKTTISLAILTFGLCHFATFLTRSGIFNSVHAFSESPIGWLFLGFMALLLVGGVALIALHRHGLRPAASARVFWSRETMVYFATLLLFALSAIVLVGTILSPVSTYFFGQAIQVDAPFYNNVATPVGILLLVMTALAPLLRWGQAPGQVQRRALCVSLVMGALACVTAYSFGVRQVLLLAVAGTAVFAGTAFLSAIFIDASRHRTVPFLSAFVRALQSGRRQYGGYVVHMGFIAMVIGITGSALGGSRHETVMHEGDRITWAGREIRYVKLEQTEHPDKLIAEAVLEVSQGGGTPVTLRPARHFHLLQNDWTTEVDIHSDWGGDFYTVLNAGLGDGRVALTFVDNPMMRWIWLGGLIAGLGALTAMWPGRRQRINSATLEPDGGDNVSLAKAA